MQFILTLTPLQRETFVPFDYPYALSAVIYRKLANADQQYANFLHGQGYAQHEHSRHFKFFTFSNLQGEFRVVKEALQLQGCIPEFIGLNLGANNKYGSECVGDLEILVRNKICRNHNHLKFLWC